MSAATHNKMICFTFLTEKEGSTIIEQFEGSEVEEAVAAWYLGSETLPGELDESDEVTPISGMENVWCIAGHDPQGAFFLVHIVATARS